MDHVSPPVNPRWLRILRAIGLPLPMATELLRADGPFHAAEMAELPLRAILRGPMLQAVTEAQPMLFGDRGVPDGGPLREALVVDVSGWNSADSLADLYGLLCPRLSTLGPNSRVIFVTAYRDDPDAFVIAEAITGFCRSLAKEIGRKGSTANVLSAAPGAAPSLAPWLAFLASRRSAYVSGQVINVSGILGGARAPTEQSLSRQTALVTGAGQGIGLAIAQRLAEEGMRVIGLDRPGGTTLGARMAELGGHAIELDLASPDVGTQLALLLTPFADSIDVLVNNAGVTRDRTFRNLSRQDWQTVLDVNLHAAMRVTEALLERHLAPHARIVMLSSISGLAGNAGQTNYATAKAGIVGYVRAMAGKLAERGAAINAVAPGFIDTPMTAQMPFAVREIARRFNALGQAGQPRDVAELVAFLARPEAVGVTGETIRICGLNVMGR